MRGYFGIGVEGISKPMNVGSLFRTAHAFNAHFVFAINPQVPLGDINKSDTSDSSGHVPLYRFDSPESMTLPHECALVGIELLDDAAELPSFRHPHRAAYVLGPERGSLSPALQARCDFTVKIPTKFCVNLATAGAIVMYDRLMALGRFADRPMMPGGKADEGPDHVYGAPVLRQAARSRRSREQANKD